MHKYDLIMAPHPFFHGMCDDYLKTLAELMEPVHFPKGTYIFHEGEIANRFYLLSKGKVSLEASTGGGARVTVQNLGSGEVLGWSWMYPPYFWRFDAHATDETDALVVAATRLRECCEAEKNFGYELLHRIGFVIVQRLQTVRLKMVEEAQAADGRRL